MSLLCSAETEGLCTSAGRAERFEKVCSNNYVVKNFAEESISSDKLFYYCSLAKRGPVIKYPPTSHYCFNFMQRSEVYSKKRPPN